MKGHYWVYIDAATAAAAAATHIAERLDEAVRDRGHASLAISGGNSPKALFRELVKTGVDWTHVRLFWVDERAVPPGHEQSNYSMALDHLITPAGIPGANVVRMEGELAPADAAGRYERALRERFPGAAVPVFDVIHLGMGPDGHTASLFPGEPLIQERHHLVAAVHVEKLKSDRITLLPPLLHLARCAIVFAPGADKAPVLKQVFEGPRDPSKLPVQLLDVRTAETTWFLDEDAAAQLSPQS
ncbi:MAG: 6-phosphogluconolactonase [Acidobacteriota bacterium]